MIHAEFVSLQTNMPDNVFEKRMPKAWNNSDQHQTIIRIQGLTLQPYLREYQPTLSYDAAPLHLNAAVVSEDIMHACSFCSDPQG